MEAYSLDNYSYEDYLEIDSSTPDSERYELIFGHIYMMSGASRVHQDVVGNVFYIFKTLQKTKNCSAVIAPYDVKLKCDEETNVVQPDVMLFCDEKSDIPCLVVEVLSPSTAKKDKTVKFNIYEKQKVNFYIIVNIKKKVAEIFELKNNKYNKVGDFSKNKYSFEFDECNLNFDFG